jgi:hypothetical protein
MKPVALGKAGIIVTREIFDGLTTSEAVESEIARIRNDEEAFVIRKSSDQIVLDYEDYLEYLKQKRGQDNVAELKSLVTKQADQIQQLKTAHGLYKTYDGRDPIQDDFDIFVDGLVDEEISREDFYAMLLLRGLYGDKVAKSEFPVLHKLLMTKLGE